VSAVGALLRKDLRLELRTRESVPAMTLFSLSAFVVFHFGLQRSSLDGDLAAGVLWVTLLLAALLGVGRLFVTEREEGGFDAIRLAPVDPSAMLVAKALTLLSFLAIVQLVAVPGFGILLLGPSLLPALPGLLAVLALADVGIAVIGTLASALAVQTRARELIVALMGLPLLVPVVLAAARATAPLFSAGGASPPPLRWLGLLGLYDLVFALVAYAVFDYLLDD
jgi:heme exporter protein B